MRHDVEKSEKNFTIDFDIIQTTYGAMLCHISIF